MFFYNPTDNDVLKNWIKYSPRCAFIMTQLGEDRSETIEEILSQITSVLNGKNINNIDANSVVTGRDFHSKIWKLALSVPIGIAVVSETIRQTTIANIYYEIGLMNALGKETLVVKTKDFKIPSDFIRTEYIKHSDKFEEQFSSFIDQTLEQAEYYGLLADNLIAKPLLSIDYLRRAYLISGDNTYKESAMTIIAENEFDEHSLLMAKSYFNITD